MAETEDALRAEVLTVCRTYCAQTWNEALNQAGVEASSVLREARSVYYLPAIRPASSADSKADPLFLEAGETSGDPPKATPAAKTSLEEVGQAEDILKLEEANKEGAQGFNLPPPAPKDPSKEQEALQSMELVLATLIIPPKEDPKDKAEVSTTVASTQPPKDSKDKLVIKMKTYTVLVS